MKRYLAILILLTACGDDASAPPASVDSDADADSGAPDVGSPGDGGTQRSFPGDYTIENAEDAEFIAAFAEITGTLTVRAPDLEALSLPRLESLGGGLRLSGSGDLTDVDLPILTTVGGSVSIVGNRSLADLDGLAALERAGEITVSDSPAVEEIVWPNLVAVGGSLVFGVSSRNSNTGLRRLELAGLTDIDGTLQLAGNSELHTVSLDALAGTDGLFIQDNAALEAFELPLLARVSGSLTLDDNAALATLDLGALQRLDGRFRVTGNALPTCRVEALLGALRIAGYRGDVEVSGNDDGQTCDDLCGPVGDTNRRDQVCLIDGEFHDACDEAVCLAESRLCQSDLAAFDLNLCVFPGAVTANCDAAAAFEEGRGEGGPVIWVSPSELDPEAEVCLEGEVLRIIELSWSDLEGDASTEDSPEARDAVRWAPPPLPPEEEGGEPIVVPPVAVELELLYAEDVEGVAGSVAVSVCVGEEVGTVALQMADTSGAVTNVACSE